MLEILKTELENILSNPENEKVLKFLGIKKEGQHRLLSFEDKDSYTTHEGLENFFKIGVPAESKFMLDHSGIIILPETGAITAFQFGRFDIAFKIADPNRFRSNYRQIKQGLLRNLNIRSSFKVSLGYFSNIYDDPDTIIDIRELGSEWALSIYFLDLTGELIQEFYHESLNNQRR